MKQKTTSSVLACNGDLYVDVDLLGYDGNGLLICIIAGKRMIQPEVGGNCFVEINDAIDLLIKETLTLIVKRRNEAFACYWSESFIDGKTDLRKVNIPVDSLMNLS